MEEYNNNSFSIKGRVLSFKYAFNGLKVLLSQEHNIRIHLIISIFAVIIGILLNISAVEWLIILALIGLVLSLEAINSAIEKLCDFVSPEWDKAIKGIKDISAAAVLIAAIISAICGMIIFIPKFCDFFGRL